jgi:TonB family protein
MSIQASKSASFPVALLLNFRSLLATLALGLAIVIPGTAQQPQPSVSKEQEQGIASYKNGDFRKAIKQLEAAVKKNSTDSESWYYLGLARLQNNDDKNGRKALEKAVKLSPQLSKMHSAFAYALLLSGKNEDAEREALEAVRLNQQDESGHYVIGALRLRQHRNTEAEAEAETVIKLNSGMALAYLLKSQALVGIYSDRTVSPYRAIMPVRRPAPVDEAARAERRQLFRSHLQLLGRAASALESYLSLSAQNSESELWRLQLKTLKAYGASDETGEKIFPMAEVDTKPQILSKPEAAYTEAARKAGVSGTVLLDVALAPDGEVKHILVLRALPLGLTQQCINVARQIKFIPGLVDGKPVSVMVRVEYSFMIF